MPAKTYVVTLRTLANPSVCEFELTSQSQEFAQRWVYRVQNRSRWTTETDAKQTIEEEATKELIELGVSKSQLRSLAKAGVIEVHIPFTDDEFCKTARELPWEFLISAATKRLRGESPICVVRHLDVPKKGKSTKAPEPRVPVSFAMIETAPGSFREIKTFDAERELVRGSLQSAKMKLKQISVPIDPTRAELKSAVTNPCPDVIHITGIDAHRGHQLLAAEGKLGSFETECTTDGIYVAGPELIGAADLAKGINSGTSKPMFVGFNCWYSGTLLAPTCIAEGTETAMGFQNGFDDLVAETFYSNFYRCWLERKQDVLCAFLEAWEAIVPFKEKIKGTGIILWTRESFFAKNRRKGHITPNKKGIEKAKSLFAQRQEARSRRARPATPDKFNICDLVGVKAKPVERLNYSMLHNRRSLLDELYLWFKVPESEQKASGKHFPGVEFADSESELFVQDIDVEVLLMIGGDSFPYRTQVTLSHNNPSIDLADTALKPTMGNPGGGIQVPLISDLARTVDERMQTSLYINIQWHGQTLYRHTHTVSLTPTDEWSLEDEDICWLPSFVQPRDKAVAQIISSAQKYLRCLNDDPVVGFVGYQGDSDAVDAQAKAIWMAIVYEYRLEYICPPPSYSPNAQRLRTPSQLISQNHGTCLDLTLLFVSCLEWIELYPVILQTEIHAFAGYWVSEKARKDFLAMNKSKKKYQEDVEASKVSLNTQGNKDTHLPERPWISGKHTYNEIREYIFNDLLVPIECVSLTENASFNTAWDFAKQYFSFTELEVRKRFSPAQAYLDACTIHFNREVIKKIKFEAKLKKVERKYRAVINQLNANNILAAEKHKALAMESKVTVEDVDNLTPKRCIKVAKKCSPIAKKLKPLAEECKKLIGTGEKLSIRSLDSKSKLDIAKRKFQAANQAFEQEKEYYDAARAVVEFYQDYEPPEDGNIDPKTMPHNCYDNFHSMIDICTARSYVTPLPLKHS